MRFTIEHAFECDPDRLWELLRSPDYIAAVDERAGLTRTLLDERQVRDEWVQRIRFVPDRSLPPAAQKAMGREKLEYVQEQRWRNRDRSMRWRVDIAGLEGRYESHGDLLVAQARKGWCNRRVHGLVTVSLPLIGERIAKRIIVDIEESYEGAAVATRELLSTRGPESDNSL
ncbi:MAG TPA: DUF2505 family protein [Myxococcota bacterium]|nr:DUF2505 family protein [Myxococcota bacterium]